MFIYFLLWRNKKKEIYFVYCKLEREREKVANFTFLNFSDVGIRKYTENKTKELTY